MLSTLFLFAALAAPRAKAKTPPLPNQTPPPPVLNQLGSSPSRFLREHSDNAVDWQPWGDAAFAKAKREDKPVFLSIGYASCHWCHVMERESFQNEEIARM